MTVLCGETALQAQTMTDKEVVDSCMNILRKLFTYKVMQLVHNVLTFFFFCSQIIVIYLLVVEWYKKS